MSTLKYELKSTIWKNIAKIKMLLEDIFGLKYGNLHARYHINFQYTFYISEESELNIHKVNFFF